MLGTDLGVCGGEPGAVRLLRLSAKRTLFRPRVERFAAVPAEARERCRARLEPALDIGDLALGFAAMRGHSARARRGGDAPGRQDVVEHFARTLIAGVYFRGHRLQ